MSRIDWQSRILQTPIVACRDWFTQRDLATDLGTTSGQLRTHIRQLKENEVLEKDRKFIPANGSYVIVYRMRAQFRRQMHSKWRKTDNSWLDLPDQFGVAR